jgi:hypothetical protein
MARVADSGFKAVQVAETTLVEELGVGNFVLHASEHTS